MGAKTLPSRPRTRKTKKRVKKIVQPITIQNRLGLHARAAAAFVKMAFHFRSDIDLIHGKNRVNGKSIMGLLTLAASQGTQLTIEASGMDAEKAVAALIQLVNDKFGEA